MKKTMRLFTFTTFLYCLSTITAFAAQPLATIQHAYQALEPIHELVTEHVKQKVGQNLFEVNIQLRKLSPQLQLAYCQKPLQLNDRSLGETVGRMTISVSCPQPKWRVFIPVVVDGKKNVIISTQGILKRAVITSEDVKQVLLPYKKVPRGSMVDLSKVIGMRTKKAIGPGNIIKIRSLQPPYLVFKNQNVNIVTRSHGIEVKTHGIALKNGVIEEQIPVKNSSSNKIIKGIVIAPNTVFIP